MKVLLGTDLQKKRPDVWKRRRRTNGRNHRLPRNEEGMKGTLSMKVMIEMGEEGMLAPPEVQEEKS